MPQKAKIRLIQRSKTRPTVHRRGFFVYRSFPASSYELLDFRKVYGTACGVVVEHVYCRLHQRNQFVRNPHCFVASWSVRFLPWLLCGRCNRNHRNRRIILQIGIKSLNHRVYIYHAGFQRLKQMHPSDVSDTGQRHVALTRIGTIRSDICCINGLPLTFMHRDRIGQGKLQE